MAKKPRAWQPQVNWKFNGVTEWTPIWIDGVTEFKNKAQAKQALDTFLQSPLRAITGSWEVRVHPLV